MCMSDWASRTSTKINPETLYAGQILERYGFIFGVDFDVATAIDKVSVVLNDHADEEEHLLMEGKQIAEKIAIDEPRIQDRRTYSKNGWDL